MQCVPLYATDHRARDFVRVCQCLCTGRGRDGNRRLFVPIPFFQRAMPMCWSCLPAGVTVGSICSTFSSVKPNWLVTLQDYQILFSDVGLVSVFWRFLWSFLNGRCVHSTDSRNKLLVFGRRLMCRRTKWNGSLVRECVVNLYRYCPFSSYSPWTSSCSKCNPQSCSLTSRGR